MKRGFPTKNLLYLHKRRLALLRTLDQIWVTLLGKIIQWAGQGQLAQTSSSKQQAPRTRPTRSWTREGWDGFFLLPGIMQKPGASTLHHAERLREVTRFSSSCSFSRTVAVLYQGKAWFVCMKGSNC